MENNKLNCNILKIATYIAKRIEIWEFRVQVEHIWSTFDLVQFKVNVRKVGDLAIFWKYNNQNAASSALMIPFQSNMLHVFPCECPQKSYFLEFWNLKFKSRKKPYWNLTLWQMGKWKMVNILKMANCWAKRSKTWGTRGEGYSEVLVEGIWDNFDIVMFRVIWGGSGMWGNLDVVQLKVMLGSFGAGVIFPRTKLQNAVSSTLTMLFQTFKVLCVPYDSRRSW